MNEKDKSREELLLELEGLKEAYAALQTLYKKGLDDRRLAEAELRVSERRFRQVAESAGEWIWEVDAKGLYTYSSPVIEEMLGYTPDEIVGKKHFFELFYGDNREETKHRALEFFASKQALKDFVNQNVHKNGNVVWLSTTGKPDS